MMMVKFLLKVKTNTEKIYQIEYEPPGYELIDEKTGKAVKTKGEFRASEDAC